MPKLLAWGSVLAAALVFIACQDATEPAAIAGSGGSGSDTECRNVVLTGTLDNVVVPPGAFCFLENSTVLGNVDALANSELRIRSTTVRGNVKAHENSFLTIRSTTVRGNVDSDKANSVSFLSFALTGDQRNLVLGNIHLKEHGEVEGAVELCGTHLPEGNIEIQKMRRFVIVGSFACLSAGGGNTLLKGTIKVEDNEIIEFTSLLIGDNSVGGNLQVFKNRGLGLKFVENKTVHGNLQCFENDPPFVGGPNVAGKAEGQCF
jgi:hypothetical protein